MALDITKILFRRGLDIVRRIGGGAGVILNSGEPGFCSDTKRMYVGDGTRIGGWPAGCKIHSTIAGLTGAGPFGYSSTAYATLTSKGVDTGDLIWDNTSCILYAVSSKGINGNSSEASVASGGLSAVPAVSELQPLHIISQLSGTNGLSSIKVNNYAFFSLHPTYFDIQTSPPAINLKADTFVTNNLYLSGTLYADGGFSINGPTTINNTLDVSSTITANGGGAGKNSVNWFNAWTYINANSAAFSANTSILSTVSSAPFVQRTGVAYREFRTTGATNSQVVVNDCYFGINTANASSVRGLIVSNGVDTTNTALSVIGSIQATGDVIAYATSDQRLKQNIQPLTNCLEKLQSIQGVEFDWATGSYKSGHDVGVLAQDVEKVFPEVVVTREDGYKAVNYEKLTVLLIQAVKELAAKIK